MTLKALNLYRPENNATLSAFWMLCKAAGIALIATLAALFFIFHHDAYSRWVMLLASGFSLVWLFLGRLVLHRFRQAVHAQGVGVNRVALVGYDARVETFVRALKAKGSSYQFVGIIRGETGSENPQQVGASSPENYQNLGQIDEVLQLVQTHQLDTLFIASPTVSNDTILQILHACEGVPVQINLLPELSEFIRSGTAITFFDDIPVLQLRETPMQGIQGSRQTFYRHRFQSVCFDSVKSTHVSNCDCDSSHLTRQRNFPPRARR